MEHSTKQYKRSSIFKVQKSHPKPGKMELTGIEKQFHFHRSGQEYLTGCDRKTIQHLCGIISKTKHISEHGSSIRIFKYVINLNFRQKK